MIENGADFDDFEGIDHVPNDRFTIVHAGSFFGQRSPRPFLRALAALLARRPELRDRLLARFIGDLRGDDREFAAGARHRRGLAEEGFLPYARIDPRPARGRRAAAA